MSAPTPPGLSRRAWSRLVAAGVVGLSSGCGDNLDPAVETGLAVLEPEPDRLLVSVWASRGSAVVVTVHAGGRAITSYRVELGPGGVGTVDVTGLAPDRAYELTVDTAAGPIGPCRARTAPAPDATRPVRIAVSADFDPDPIFASAVIDHVLAAAPELFVSLGDFPYTDNGPPAQTVAEYRRRHLDLRVEPASRRLFEGVGLRAIYDDHEFRNDWDHAFALAEPDRYAAAMQVWDEMFPVRAAVGDVRYRRWRWGAHLECFLLDCRRYRAANAAPDDASKSMLGETQRTWLLAGLAASTATFKLIFTSVPLDFSQGNDAWAAFTHDRQRLLDALVGIPGVLFVAADQHYFAAHRHAHGVREIQVGPLARGLGALGPDGPGVLFRYQGYNAGLFEVSGERLRVIGVGADGQRFYQEDLTPEALTPA